MFFVARHGKLLGVFCVFDMRDSDLYLTVHPRPKSQVDKAIFHCSDLERVSPVIHVVKSIVAVASYNGFGCINFKFVSADGSPFNLRQHLTILPAATEETVMVDFSNINNSNNNALSFPASPRFFEINARMCRSLTHHAAVLREMIRLYSANM